MRNELEKDYREVEKLIRRSFYNLYIPGCIEHYLAHMMRNHQDFINELDFVLEKDGKIIGQIMYTKAVLVDENKERKEVLTFGPICIDKAYQRQGYGKMLIEHSFKKAQELGYDCVVIFGNPGNYVSRGFKSCLRYNVCLEGDVYPSAMLVKVLKDDVLDGRKYYYYDSEVMHIDEKEAMAYDEIFEEKLDKQELPCQEEFFIHSHAYLKL